MQVIDENSINWTSIWKWQGAYRVKTFLWPSLKDRLLTNRECFRRHLSDDPFANGVVKKRNLPYMLSVTVSIRAGFGFPSFLNLFCLIFLPKISLIGFYPILNQRVVVWIIFLGVLCLGLLCGDYGTWGTPLCSLIMQIRSQQGNLLGL